MCISMVLDVVFARLCIVQTDHMEIFLISLETILVSDLTVGFTFVHAPSSKLEPTPVRSPKERRIEKPNVALAASVQTIVELRKNHK